MYSIFKIIRIRACGFEDPKTQGHIVPLGEGINPQFEKEKELLSLLKTLVKSKKPARYFVLMLILQQKIRTYADEDQGENKSNTKHENKELSPGRPSGFSLFAVNTYSETYHV